MAPKWNYARCEGLTAPCTQSKPHVQHHRDSSVSQRTSTLNADGLISELAKWLHELQHDKNRSRVDILASEDQAPAIVDGAHNTTLAPPPGLEDLQPKPHISTPQGLEAIGLAPTPQYAEPRL